MLLVTFWEIQHWGWTKHEYSTAPGPVWDHCIATGSVQCHPSTVNVIKWQMKPRLSSNTRWIYRSPEIPRGSIIVLASESPAHFCDSLVGCRYPIASKLSPVTEFNSLFLHSTTAGSLPPCSAHRSLSSRQRPRRKAAKCPQNKHKHNAWLDTKTARGCKGH